MDTESQAAPTGASDTTALETELAAAKALSDERYRDLQYAHAETENIRKRAERTSTERIAFNRVQLLAKFLPVLDNLQRALAFDDSTGLRGGLQATLRGFEGILTGEKVTILETVGKPFDPRIAEAIATRETADADDDVVVEEAQRGYKLGDDLLRPALVVVAKRVPGPGE